MKRMMLASLMLLLAGCKLGKDSGMYWYEEAMQDDGSIVMVKKMESGSSASRKEPGAGNYGYRLPKVEFTDPKTGRSILWYPANLPFLLPYALHIHEGVPYMFATFYLSTSYRQFGCPIPPYIVFRWEADKWKRISMSELPRQFKRRNLLDTAGTQIDVGDSWKFIEPGDTVKAESIERYVRSISSMADKGHTPHIYEKEIQYEDIGPYDECNGIKNRSTQYDSVEIK